MLEEWHREIFRAWDNVFNKDIRDVVSSHVCYILHNNLNTEPHMNELRVKLTEDAKKVPSTVFLGSLEAQTDAARSAEGELDPKMTPLNILLILKNRQKQSMHSADLTESGNSARKFHEEWLADAKASWLSVEEIIGKVKDPLAQPPCSKVDALDKFEKPEDPSPLFNDQRITPRLKEIVEGVLRFSHAVAQHEMFSMAVGSLTQRMDVFKAALSSARVSVAGIQGKFGGCAAATVEPARVSAEAPLPDEAPPAE